MAFLSLFLVVYIVVKLFEKALNRLVERIQLEGLDRALGFFLGIVEGAFVVFVIVWIVRLQSVVDVGDLLERSVIARLLLPLLPYAYRAIQVGA